MRSMVAIVVVFAVAASASAQTWERDTQMVIVTTAMHMLSKNGFVQLPKLQKEIQQGAAASPQTVAQLYPALSSGGPGRAIEAEMYLLEAMRGSKLDPYFASRLGALGALVSRITAPLQDTDSTYRTQYFADAAANVRRMTFRPSARKMVDPVPYFERLVRLANERNDLMIKDYQEGLGFGGVANAALSEDFSRSVDAVADVWNTLLTTNVAHAGISAAQRQDYVASAIQYYIGRGNAKELDVNYARLTEIVPRTPELAKRIGDMFYGAQLYDRAIREYSFVMATEPRRRDIVEKIGAYYVGIGDEHLADNRLEQALEAYAKAAEQDPLNSVAEAKRLETASLIGERDARLQTSRRHIEEGALLQREAEEFLQQSRFADAFTRLKEAEARYNMVTGEFTVEYQMANAGLGNVNTQLRELKTQLIENAQSFSGSGFSYSLQSSWLRMGKLSTQRPSKNLTRFSLIRK